MSCSEDFLMVSPYIQMIELHQMTTLNAIFPTLQFNFILRCIIWCHTMSAAYKLLLSVLKSLPPIKQLLYSSSFSEVLIAKWKKLISAVCIYFLLVLPDSLNMVFCLNKNEYDTFKSWFCSSQEQNSMLLNQYEKLSRWTEKQTLNQCNSFYTDVTQYLHKIVLQGKRILFQLKKYIEDSLSTLLGCNMCSSANVQQNFGLYWLHAMKSHKIVLYSERWKNLISNKNSCVECQAVWHKWLVWVEPTVFPSLLSTTA
jgi:hypothetical protein